MPRDPHPPRIGISRCLLGDEVRYDGGHKRDAFLVSTFGRFVDRGMLPNRFPDAGEAPEYNTVDATLWYFEAIRA